MVTSFVPTYGPKVDLPQATVDTITLGMPTGKVFITAVAMAVP